MKLTAEHVLIREVVWEHPELRVWVSGYLLHERNYEFEDGVLAFKCAFNEGTEIRVQDGSTERLFTCVWDPAYDAVEEQRLCDLHGPSLKES